MTISLSLYVHDCAASRITRPAQLFMSQMCKHARPTGEVMRGSLITGYYRGWMTPAEMEAFNAKDYVKFAEMSEAYNDKHGFGAKRKRS